MALLDDPLLEPEAAHAITGLDLGDDEVEAALAAFERPAMPLPAVDQPPPSPSRRRAAADALPFEDDDDPYLGPGPVLVWPGPSERSPSRRERREPATTSRAPRQSSHSRPARSRRPSEARHPTTAPTEADRRRGGLVTLWLGVAIAAMTVLVGATAVLGGEDLTPVETSPTVGNQTVVLSEAPAETVPVVAPPPVVVEETTTTAAPARRRPAAVVEEEPVVEEPVVEDTTPAPPVVEETTTTTQAAPVDPTTTTTPTGSGGSESGGETGTGETGSG